MSVLDSRERRGLRRARFPFLKTINDFNFIYQSRCGSRCSAPRGRLASPRRGTRLIFNGKLGHSKTHLAIMDRAIQFIEHYANKKFETY